MGALDRLADAFGLNFDHAKSETLADLKYKIAQVAKDPELARFMPSKDAYMQTLALAQNNLQIAEQNAAGQKAAWEQKKAKLQAAYSQPKFQADYAPIKDQKLIQMIGVESHMNVQLIRTYGYEGKHHSLVCEKCKQTLSIYDDTMFVESQGGLVNKLVTFCRAHRHEEKPAEVPVVGGRRFREDD